MWRKRNTSTLLVELKAVKTTLEISFVVPQKLDIVLPEVLAIPLLGIYPEDAPTCNKDTCSTLFIAALFIIARNGKNQDVFQWRNGYRNYGIYTQWSTIQLLKQ